MAEKRKISDEILQRLRTTKDNLSVLDQLISETLQKLEHVTADLGDPEKYMPTKTVREKWISREEAGNLLEAQALLLECRNELTDINNATKDVEGVLNPVMNKIKKT